MESHLESLDKELKQVADTKQVTERATNEIDQLNEEVQEWKSKSDECEKFVQDLKKRRSTIATSIGKLNRQIILKETQIEQLQSRKQEILENCEFEQIQLPILNDPMETGSSTPSPVFDYN